MKRVVVLTPPGGSPTRRRAGLAVAAVGLVVLTVTLVPIRDRVSLAVVALVYLLPVIVAAVVGGVRHALASAVTADLLVNFFFVPPFRTFAVERWEHVVVLGVYIAVAATVAVAVDVAARQRSAAARRELESALLARSTARPVTEDSLTELLDQVRDTFAMTSVALVDDDGRTVAAIGPDPDGEPSLTAPASGGGVRILAWGPTLIGEDRRVLAQLANTAARTLETQRLATEAREARELVEIDRLRTALLTAVGHDLRTPLTAIKAASSSLRRSDVEFADNDRAELIATIDESVDTLSALVENLLAMSRLQAGVLSLHLEPVALDAVTAEAILSAPAGPVVDVDVPDDLVAALADHGLLERTLANLIANARAATWAGERVQVRGHEENDRVVLAVVDHGPGVPAGDRERIFQPFQRLHDRGGGIGLGLAIARGFTEAMSGTLTASDTPGGGLTMTISLPPAPS